jgi:hypothetical protein
VAIDRPTYRIRRGDSAVPPKERRKAISMGTNIRGPRILWFFVILGRAVAEEETSSVKSGWRMAMLMLTTALQRRTVEDGVQRDAL